MFSDDPPTSLLNFQWAICIIEDVCTSVEDFMSPPNTNAFESNYVHGE